MSAGGPIIGNVAPAAGGGPVRRGAPASGVHGEHILQLFEFKHLPKKLQAISQTHALARRNHGTAGSARARAGAQHDRNGTSRAARK